MALKERESLQNQLKTVRIRLGLSQQELAETAGIARQTIGGIESQLYSPSAVVALRLAKALGCRVEEIFWIDGDEEAVEAKPAQGMPEAISARVAIARVGSQWVAHSLHGDGAFRSEMTPADGTGIWNCRQETMTVSLLDDPESLAKSVVIAGCTPALSLWARSAERWLPGLRVHWMHANSTVALKMLARGEVHCAGAHLCDPETGEFNAPFVRRELPGKTVALVHLGYWEEGLIVREGNPKGLKSVADLIRAGVRMINREQGSGTRLMLDSQLKKAGIDGARISGYDLEAISHQEAAAHVAHGSADIAIGTAAIAQTYALDFIPIQTVRYDLALMEESLHHVSISRLLDTLQHRWIRSQLSLLVGFDTGLTGEVTMVEAA